ncbi:hypothetical protein [Actinophytocola sediminis]
MIAVVLVVLAVLMIGPLLLERLERGLTPGAPQAPPARDTAG